MPRGQHFEILPLRASVICALAQQSGGAVGEEARHIGIVGEHKFDGASHQGAGDGRSREKLRVLPAQAIQHGWHVVIDNE